MRDLHREFSVCFPSASRGSDSPDDYRRLVAGIEQARAARCTVATPSFREAPGCANKIPLTLQVLAGYTSGNSPGNPRVHLLNLLLGGVAAPCGKGIWSASSKRKPVITQRNMSSADRVNGAERAVCMPPDPRCKKR